ncbi:unnamed protein product [Schistosoma rodhaini]|uniref:Uncharacterized protein n=1 Tax=Schistosoma rodhaini TaxID=6188 RepID=A0AA85ERJ5_9TREM|nr:unnamed protein product [Schistosoma rodhaini]
MPNLYDRVSFSEYIYRIKLKNVIHNKSYQDNINFIEDLSFDSSLLYSQFHNFESITFSMDYKQYMNKNDYDCSKHITINTDILKCINQCLLITDQSKYQLLSGIKCRVYWYQLARSQEFLKCLIQIIPTGYGDPYLQEIAMIVLTNICILAGYKTKYSRSNNCQSALQNLIHITAGPLVIFSSSSGLGQITIWSTQALTGLLNATFIYYPDLCVNYEQNVWMEKLLLFSHVIHVLHRLLPKVFLMESSNFGTYELLKQLSKHMTDTDDSLNLEILSSHLKLITLILMRLPSVQVMLSSTTSSSDDKIRIQEMDKFLAIIQYGFMNLCLAIGKVWLCPACSNSLTNHSLFDFLNKDDPIDDNFLKIKNCTPNHSPSSSSYDLLLFTCELLKSLLNLIQIPYLKVYFIKTNYNLIQCLLYLAKCLFYCSNLNDPLIISQCIFYIIRIIGCICYYHHYDHHHHQQHPPPHHHHHQQEHIEMTQQPYFINTLTISQGLLHNFLILIHWYYQYRCSWSICSIELCWSLTHFIQYFNISIFEEQSNQLLNNFIDFLLLKLFSLELGAKEVMFLLYTNINIMYNNNNNNNGLHGNHRDYLYWIKILTLLNDHLKPQLIYWKYLKQNLPICYIETLILLFKFLTMINMNDHIKLLKDYIKNNCPILYKLYTVYCNQTLLSSISLESLTMKEIQEILCSVNSFSTGIISYIISILEDI